MMKLNLFTASYPSSFGESYLNNEIPILVKHFSKIEIFPFDLKEGICHPLDSSISITPFDRTNREFSLLDYLILLKIIFIEFLGSNKRFYFLKNLKKHLAIAKQGLKLSKWLESQELNRDDAFYSFWMNEWAMALAILKMRDKVANFVFRVNGYDIYDERHEGNYLPFRSFIYRYTSLIIPLSITSEKYVKSKSKLHHKIKHSYFGTRDFGEAIKRKKREFTVFTCSSAIPLKRLEKIANALSLMDISVVWVHHGEGETIERVREFLLNSKSKVDFILSPKVSDYSKVIEIQKGLAPDVFVNLSETEGLPVSVIEALSLGTPVLLNDVGSCKELVNEDTGILVSVDESPANIAEKMFTFMPDKNKFDRSKIRQFWREKFSAEVNYSKFAKELKIIFNDTQK